MDEAAFRARLAQSVIVRWTSPLEAEPAYGLMARIGALHRQTSLTVFAREMNVSPGLGWEDRCFQALAASRYAVASEIDRLRRFTPIGEGKDVVIAGQRIRKADWSVTTRRYCPGCLSESAHHRVWFDLTFMSRCPYHGCSLTDGDDGGIPLNWNFTCLDETPVGRRLAVASPRPAVMPRTFEAFVLGRLGLVAGEETALFEGVSIQDVMIAADFLGRLALGGWMETMPLDGCPDSTRARGFAILSEGAPRIDELLREIAAKAPVHSFGRKTVFGWASAGFIGRRSVLTDLVVRRMSGVSARMGRSRLGRGIAMPADAQAVTVSAAASRLGIGQHTVKTLGTRLKAFRPHVKDSGLPFVMDVSEVERLAAELDAAGLNRIGEMKAASLGADAAAAVLGISPEILLSIVAAGHVSRLGFPWGGDLANRFDPKTLEALLDSIPLKEPREPPLRPGATALMSRHVMNIVEVLAHTRYDAGAFISGVMSGDIVVWTRTSLAGGLAAFRMALSDQPPDHPFAARWQSVSMTRNKTVHEAVMTRGEATALLGVGFDTVKMLLDGGFLEHASTADTRDRYNLDAASVTAFAERYLAARFYAPALECMPQFACLKLGALGVPTLTEKGWSLFATGTRLSPMVERSAARKALGLVRDPDEEDHVRCAWKEMAVWFARAKSAFMLKSVTSSGTALFNVSDGRWPTRVRYVFDGQPAIPHLEGELTYAIEASLDLVGSKGRSRIGAISSLLAERVVHEAVTVSVDAVAKTCSASMRAVVVNKRDRGFTRDVTMANYADEDVVIVGRMLHMLRATFDEGRPYDARAFGIWPVAFYRD